MWPLFIDQLAGGRHIIDEGFHLVEVVCHRHVALLGGGEGNACVDGARSSLGRQHLMDVAPDPLR